MRHLNFRITLWLLAPAVVSAGPSAPVMRAQTATDGRPPAAPARERLDYHGDPLPDGAVARIGTLRFRPAEGGGPCGVVFAAQGKTLISVHGRNTLHLWDLATGKEQSRLTYGAGQQKCQALDISASADGKRLVVAGQAGVQVWDLSGESPRPRWLKNPTGGADQAQNRTPWAGLAFSPDNQTVACGNFEKREVFLLDAVTGKQRHVLDTGLASAPWRKTQFSPDGKLLATWAQHAESRTVDLWDVATGKKKQALACRQCWFAAFAPDGRVVATMHDQQQVPQITLWDVAAGKQLQQITEGVAPIAWITFLPDGKLLQAGDGLIRFWDPATAKPCRPPVVAPGLSSGVGMAHCLSLDGKRLAIASSRAVGVWEVETGKPVGATTGSGNQVREITFSPDGKELATLSGDNEVGVWEAATGKPGQRLELADPQQPSTQISARRLGYSPDGRLYTLRKSVGPAGGGGGISISLMGWNTQTGKPLDLPALEEPQGLPPSSLDWALTPDGRHLARWETDSILRLYDLATGKEVRRLKECPPPWSLVFSADGQSLIVGGRAENQGLVTVWDVVTGRLRKSFQAGPPSPSTLSPDGRWLVVHSTNPENAHELTWWEVASGAVGPRLKAQHVSCLAYAPDGRTLALGCWDGAVQLWDIGTATELRRFTGHHAGVGALAFSPNGSRLASGSEDTTVLVWDVERSTRPKRQPADADHPKLAALWDALNRPDAAAAYRAIGQLAETPGPAVTLLRQRLQPVPAPEPAQAKRWLADLDAEQFQVRQKASAALAKCGSAVEPALRQALASQPSLETRKRIAELLKQFDNDRSPFYLGMVRGVEVLERIGTPEARKFLAELAQLPQEHLVAREAKLAVQRLAQRRPADRTP